LLIVNRSISIGSVEEKEENYKVESSSNNSDSRTGAETDEEVYLNPSHLPYDSMYSYGDDFL